MPFFEPLVSSVSTMVGLDQGTFLVGGAANAINELSTGLMQLTGGALNFAAPISVGAPTLGGHATNKTYVDALSNGLSVKAPVRAATTANITLSGAQTIDGVAVIAGDRVLVKNQTAPAENGLYVCASGAWSRSADADASAEVKSGLYVLVNEGTANADTAWVLTTNDPITLDSTSLTFTKFNALGQITAGNGLSKSSDTLSIDTAITADLASVQTFAGVKTFNANPVMTAITTAGVPATLTLPTGGNDTLAGLTLTQTLTNKTLTAPIVTNLALGGTAPLTMTQTVSASGTPSPASSWTGAAHTAITASTEYISENHNYAQTRQWATGALATQRTVLFQAPTIGFVGASTVTNAATVAISGAPAAGTNATITNSYALWSQAGLNRFEGAIKGGAAPGGSGPALWSNANTGTNAGRIFTDDTTGSFMGYGTTTFTLSGANASLTAGTTVGITGTASITLTSNSLIDNIFGGEWKARRSIAASSGVLQSFTFTGAADTNQTLSSEVIGFRVNQAQTKQWATGALTTQRANVFDAPTYAFVGASTLTKAATVAITDAPAAGTNATITNSYALWVQAGKTQLDGSLGMDTTTTTPGTVGDRTINKLSGTVNIAAAGTTVTVTNSLVTASSLVIAFLRTNDTTARIANVVPGAGSFVINIVACAAEVSIGFVVIN